MEDNRPEDAFDAGAAVPGDGDADRREFLAKLGRFSFVTPPAITMLLSTSLTSSAIAQSGGRGDRDPPPEHGGPPPRGIGGILGWLF